MLAHEMKLIKSQISSATTCLKLFRNCSLGAEEKVQRTFAIILPEDQVSYATCATCAQHPHWAAHNTL